MGLVSNCGRATGVLLRILSLLAFLALVVLTAAFGAMFGTGEWYQALEKPTWNPPAWLFGPVWSTLYVLMAIAGWLVWHSGHPLRLVALRWWLLQLVLNGAWSWLFFGLHRPGWALAEMTALLAAIVLTAVRFHRIRPVAAWLLAPYLLWVGFAWFLNFTIWRLNGGGLASLIG
ncbi:MAG: hypothetical protein GTN86_11395 [Xanthomonadales bacterium]|nr:hypothetical protein [Xanthomonadales bacterium]NIN60338.1 hypothetical protein [Xanthomonadales bacterium]NIN75690.1 hypothetical protein [Xanthomonadales bacterium]NIO14763.1 hypothetical protein [Xanthomonadales bacterium]NIP12731.1 hypothetical protein [Xanthomonadales bacterium]